MACGLTLDHDGSEDDKLYCIRSGKIWKDKYEYEYAKAEEQLSASVDSEEGTEESDDDDAELDEEAQCETISFHLPGEDDADQDEVLSDCV